MFLSSFNDYERDIVGSQVYSDSHAIVESRMQLIRNTVYGPAYGGTRLYWFGEAVDSSVSAERQYLVHLMLGYP